MNQLGGVPHFDRLSDIKSRMIYDCVDNSKGYYTNSTEKKYRSRVNVIVHLRDNSLLEKLMSEAAKIKIINIKGHEATGGLRISMYNAMPLNGVVELCKFFNEF